MEPKPSHDTDPNQRTINLLLEEYKVLYGLVTFRTTSLDRRVPIATAALASFLGSIAVVPPASQTIFLAGLPLAQVWLVRTTINHARSFEDVLRRIDEIERRVNELAGEEVLVFQSRHPSNGKAIGGRTGLETVWTVYTTALLMLGACVYLAALSSDTPNLIEGYASGCGAIALYLTFLLLRLGRYRYIKARTAARPAPRPSLRARWKPTLRRYSWGAARRARTRPGRRRPKVDTTPDTPSPSI